MTSQSCGPTRPTPAELTLARALIQRAKAADSRIRNADELMVCSAIACHAGECKGNPTRCAALMGKTISKPKLVRDWIERIEKLGPLPASPPPLCTPALLPPPAPQPTAPSPAELAEEERRRAAERQADCQAAYMKRKREVPKRDWNALSGQQRAAAGTFGFTEETWPLRFDATWWYAIDFPPAWAAPGIRVPPWLRRWGKLTEVELAAANALGYNRKQWQAEEHPEGLLRCDMDDSESGSDLDEVPACAGPTYEELLCKLVSQIQTVEKRIPEYERQQRHARFYHALREQLPAEKVDDWKHGRPTEILPEQIAAAVSGHAGISYHTPYPQHAHPPTYAHAPTHTQYTLRTHYCLCRMGTSPS